MTLKEVMLELETLSNERMKQLYLGQGAKEPVFGVATGAMKPLAKKLKNNQELAEQLYATKNYDAMYLAGMIANVATMQESDFDRWMETAYFHNISDFIVAVTLSETPFAFRVADRWIASSKELYMSAGYSCYCWLLGNRKDHEFDVQQLKDMMQAVKDTIHLSPNRAKYAMSQFVMTVGVSFTALHEEALSVAKEIGVIEVERGNKKQYLNAAEDIEVAKTKGRIGFKRKYVRC